MYTINPSERINISSIVVGLNSPLSDFYRPEKHRASTSEVEQELSFWHTASSKDGGTAHIHLLSMDQVSRVATYTMVSQSKISKDMLLATRDYLFSRFNLDKISCDVIYDRSDLIKNFIAIGGSIEIRKRQHAFIGGKYQHVVEIALFPESK